MTRFLEKGGLVVLAGCGVPRLSLGLLALATRQRRSSTCPIRWSLPFSPLVGRDCDTNVAEL